MRTDYDVSTIDADKLAKLPVLKLPPTYRLQTDPGNCCAGDPPGYPTYFTRSVYTQHGNGPRRGAETEIFGRVCASSDDYRRSDNFDGQGDWDAMHARRMARLRALYLPLPFDHPRVQAWITATCIHLQHCYRDAERLEYGKPGTLISPVPYYKLKSPRIDEHWTEEYKAAVRAEADAFNRQETERAERIATIDNHQAVIRVREFYPDWTPTHGELAERAGRQRPGDWWGRHSEQPAPEACRPPRWMGKHRTDGPCQFCGHVSGYPEVTA